MYFVLREINGLSALIAWCLFESVSAVIYKLQSLAFCFVFAICTLLVKCFDFAALNNWGTSLQAEHFARIKETFK